MSKDQFQVRMPPGLRDLIAQRAQANNRSMNAEIVYLLESALFVMEEPEGDPVREAGYILKSIAEQLIAGGLKKPDAPKQGFAQAGHRAYLKSLEVKKPEE